jgi:purine-binding chemotaxis protein CheW
MPERAVVRQLVWKAGGIRCAASLDALIEVVPAGGITPIPGVAGAISGLANVRGRVVTVIDGRVLVDAPSPDPPALLVLVRVGDRTLALGVDEVEDLVTDLAGARPLDLEALLAPLFPE